MRIDPYAECEIDDLDTIIGELATGRPVQYVLGHTEFYGRDFAVGEGVLIPRPETEELVAWIASEVSSPCAILDIGTGSGCIAATLAAEIPGAMVTAVDISDDALEIAAENCRRLGVGVEVVKADAMALDRTFGQRRFDIMVSNPPYIPASERRAMHVNVVEHEPDMALFVPDDDPLRFYRAIACQGRKMLNDGGRLWFEIHHTMGRVMEEMLNAEGYAEIRIRRDLSDKERMVCCRKR